MPSTDARRDAPAFHRNIGPILEVLSTRISASTGNALEIGSGTGQHVTQFAKAFPNKTWWPTDYAFDNLASIDAWRLSEGSTNVEPASQLDAAQPDWDLGIEGRPPSTFDTIFTANVIHISPWAVCTGIIEGAARHLTPDGNLFFYGPFFRSDTPTAPGNQTFDQDLRSRNPQWGIRQLEDIVSLAGQVGFPAPEIIEMPANNLIVHFRRA